jgi:hypothetical protein
MNTTHSTTKGETIPYTVVSGSRESRIPKESSFLTILALNRSAKFNREEFLTRLIGLESVEILCIEGAESAFDIESRARKFPNVRFLLLKREVTPGEMINLGFREVKSERVLVVWTDMKIADSTWNVLKKLTNLCTVPKVVTAKAEQVPSIQVPALFRRRLKVMPWPGVKDGMMSVYPFDYCGVYDRKKFLLIGGYDSAIKNPYWQKMDLGFRVFLWGERIVCDTGFEVAYEGEVTSEDSTPDASYKIFYLKNVAVKHRKGVGELPFYKYFRYLLCSDTGPLYSLREFFAVRRWVEENKSKFKLDTKQLITDWEVPD